MLQAYNRYKKFISYMNKVIDVVSILLMLSMVGVVFYQVIMRNVFERPPVWGEEVSVTLMVWFVFLGVVLGLEEDLHVGITLFVSKLKPKIQFFLEVVVHILTMVLSLTLLVYGYRLASRMLALGTRLPATGMPAAIHEIVIPITAVMLLLVCIGKIAGMFINGKESENDD